MTLRVLSYNIAFNNNAGQNVDGLAKYVLTHKFDLVLLQEVTDKNTYISGKSPFARLEAKLGPSFHFSKKTNSHRTHHDSLLLVSKAAVWSGTPEFRVEKIPHSDRRHFVTFSGELNGQAVVVTTAHLASEFFCKKATQHKAEQLLAIQESQRQASGLRIFMGDTNLTGGPGLTDENRAVQSAGWVDAWKEWKAPKNGFNTLERKQNSKAWK
jgi:endonuclease/exonuclease/phosphatase family metal-dependent hydrolase